MTTSVDVLNALNVITGGRMIESVEMAKYNPDHPFVIMKSSGIHGKEVLEIPSLVYGPRDKEIKKIAVCMTMTELGIELAGATGVDAIVAHHPVADAASCGGVTLKNYLDLYQIAVFECHEAFHGLHPGIAYLHGHRVSKADISYGGVHGNVMFIGSPIEGVRSMNDILTRLDGFMGLETEEKLLQSERNIKGADEIIDVSLVTRGCVLAGDPDEPINGILHIFPHTGFTPEHMRQALKENPDVDTVVASISRVYEGHELIEQAQALGLKFMVGNSHVLEILENGMPLARALQRLLPDVEVVIFRERVTSTPVQQVGGQKLQQYAERFSDAHLMGKNLATLPTDFV